jgi:lysophospholipid hydrolase
MEMGKKLGSLWQLLSDATLPLMSYFEGKKFGESIQTVLGVDVQIEDLWIKYFCVTTNISKADICIHRMGTLWRAVRASMTILDYLPPMQAQNGDLLIDGGMLFCHSDPSLLNCNTVHL